jgi:hypothetical protein
MSEVPLYLLPDANLPSIAHPILNHNTPNLEHFSEPQPRKKVLSFNSWSDTYDADLILSKCHVKASKIRRRILMVKPSEI